MSSFPYFHSDIDSVFLKDFAVDATITKEDGTTVDLRGILNTSFEENEIGNYVLDVHTSTFLIRYSENVQDVKRNDTLEIDGVQYKISSSPQSDGTGMAMIYMVPLDILDSTGETFQ